MFSVVKKTKKRRPNRPYTINPLLKQEKNSKKTEIPENIQTAKKQTKNRKKTGGQFVADRPTEKKQEAKFLPTGRQKKNTRPVFCRQADRKKTGAEIEANRKRGGGAQANREERNEQAHD